MRLLIRFVCVLLIALGTGLVAYGASVDGKDYHAPLGIGILYGPSETVAWGVGMLVGGALFLVAFGLRAPFMDKQGRA